MAFFGLETLGILESAERADRAMERMLLVSGSGAAAESGPLAVASVDADAEEEEDW